MSGTDDEASQVPAGKPSGWARLSEAWSRFVGRLPLGLALSAVTAVWAFGAVWSFTEQSAFARAKGFSDPALLPLVLDGLAVAMAGVAFAASLDARPAVGARLGTALAVASQSTSNGLWAAERSTGPTGPDWTTVAIGAGIPIAANIAFEVLLGELRRQVQRRRGLPAPAALPSLRLVRLLLDLPTAFREWRTEVLALTSPAAPRPPQPTEELSAPEPRAELGPAPDQPDDVLAPQDAVTEPGQGEDPALEETAQVVTPATDTALEPGPRALPAGRPSARLDPDHGEHSAPEPGLPEQMPATASGSDTGIEVEFPDERVRLLARLLAHDPGMKGPDAEKALAEAGMGTSGRTARRLLGEAKQGASSSAVSDRGDSSPHDAPARTGTDDSVGPAPLSLVPRSSPAPPDTGDPR